MRLSHSGVFVDDSGNSSNTASNLTLTTGSIKFNSAGSSDTMSQSSIPYWNGKVDQSAYDDLYSAFTALNDLVSQYSAYFSSISAKVDNSAIGVTE